MVEQERRGAEHRTQTYTAGTDGITNQNQYAYQIAVGHGREEHFVLCFMPHIPYCSITNRANASFRSELQQLRPSTPPAFFWEENTSNVSVWQKNKIRAACSITQFRSLMSSLLKLNRCASAFECFRTNPQQTSFHSTEMCTFSVFRSISCVWVWGVCLIYLPESTEKIKKSKKIRILSFLITSLIWSDSVDHVALSCSCFWSLQGFSGVLIAVGHLLAWNELNRMGIALYSTLVGEML